MEVETPLIDMLKNDNEDTGDHNTTYKRMMNKEKKIEEESDQLDLDEEELDFKFKELENNKRKLVMLIKMTREREGSLNSLMDPPPFSRSLSKEDLLVLENKVPMKTKEGGLDRSHQDNNSIVIECYEPDGKMNYHMKFDDLLNILKA